MENRFSSVSVRIGESYESPFLNRAGVYQDGTVPLCRDAEGMLWAMSGHSHAGFIGMFAGSCLDDMTLRYPVSLNFCVGDADYAFDGIRYPEGVRARGSIWPFGLYICPGTGRFFCFFHNETGWNGKGTAYDAYGPCEQPHGDSDFRHVGLMHSDDRGRNWTFDRWVLASEEVCLTSMYDPGARNVKGQPAGIISLGSGDFSMLNLPGDPYLYLFYNVLRFDTARCGFSGCDVCIARTRKRNDGVMGGFVKYYDSAFCEPGIFGKETPVIRNLWHPRAAYCEALHCYVLTGKAWQFENGVRLKIPNTMELRTSEVLTEWSGPVTFPFGDGVYGNHYHAAVSAHGRGDPAVLTGSTFTVMQCHNGTDVLCNDFTFST